MLRQKRKYPKKRRPAARRIPAPAMPLRARPELAARYRRAASDSRPLKTLSGTSVSARADGTGASSYLFWPSLKRLWDSNPQSGQIKPDFLPFLIISTVTTPPLAPSSMPTGGAAAVLSGWLSERLDVSQSRVPAVPQQCQAPEGRRRPCLLGGL